MGTATEMLTNSLGEGAGVGQSALRYVVGGATAIGLGIKSFQSIPEGSVGVKTRFGKVSRHKRGEQAGMPIIREAGARLTFPGIHSYRIVNLRYRSTDLESGAVELPIEHLGSDEKRSLQASIIWRVSGEGDAPYRALFGVEDGSLVQTVTNVCLSGLRQVIETHGKAVLNDSARLFTETNARTNEWLNIVGVVLEAVQLKDTTLSEAQVVAGALNNPYRPDNTQIIDTVRSAIVAVPGLRQDSEIA